MVSIKMLQWLDGVRTPRNYLIVRIRWTEIWPFVSLQNSFGRVFIYFCVIIFVFLCLCIYFLCELKQFLDGVRTPLKCLIVCIWWAKSFTICVFTNEFVKPIGAILRSFSGPALPARMVSIRVPQWLDGDITPPNYLIVRIRWTWNLTICILTEWVCRTHWSYAQIIFSTSFAHQDGLNKDATMARWS